MFGTLLVFQRCAAVQGHTSAVLLPQPCQLLQFLFHLLHKRREVLVQEAQAQEGAQLFRTPWRLAVGGGQLLCRQDGLWGERAAAGATLARRTRPVP